MNIIHRACNNKLFSLENISNNLNVFIQILIMIIILIEFLYDRNVSIVLFRHATFTIIRLHNKTPYFSVGYIKIEY